MSGYLPSTLSSGQYAKVRGNHSTTWLTVMNPNTVKFAARVNQSSFETSLSSIAFDGVTVGSYSGVKVGWMVYFSHTSSINDAYFRGRVRKAPTSSVLYINRTSAAISDNDYIFITKDTGFFEKLPAKSGDTYYFDDDIAFRELLPTIEGVPSVVAGKLTSGGNVDFAFAPTGRAATYGASISTWGWDSDGGTYQAGSSSAQNVTIRFTAAGWYEIRVTVTDSAGRTSFRRIVAIVYPEDYSSIVAPNLICTGVDYDAISNTGWTASFEITAGSAITNMLPLTEVVVIAEDVFGSTAGSIISNIKFWGRIRKDDTEQQVGKDWLTSSSNLDADGIGAQLQNSNLATIAMRWRSAPTEMGEMQHLTVWRAIHLVTTELSTLSNLCSISYGSVDETYELPLLGTEDGVAGEALASIAYVINAYLNFSPTGEIEVQRHQWYLASSAKSSLIKMFDWDKQDWVGKLKVSHDHIQKTGQLITFGGTYNTSSGKTQAIRARVPAETWGSGVGKNQLNRQVLASDLSLTDAQEELALRSGADYAARNLLYQIEAQHPSGYDNVLLPNVHQYCTFSMDATDSLTGYTTTTSKRWWLKSVSVRWNAKEFRTTTTARYVEDVTAVNVKIITEIPPDELPYTIPSLPPFVDSFLPALPGLWSPSGEIAPGDEQPFTPDEAKSVTSPPSRTTTPDEPGSPTTSKDEGSVVMTWNSAGVWICSDFGRSSAPSWTNISPTTSGITQAIFDPHTAGGWVISNDGTNSVVWRADNILSPSWTSASVSGVFTQIRTTSTAGEIYIRADRGTEWTQTWTGTELSAWQVRQEANPLDVSEGGMFSVDKWLSTYTLALQQSISISIQTVTSYTGTVYVEFDYDNEQTMRQLAYQWRTGPGYQSANTGNYNTGANGITAGVVGTGTYTMPTLAVVGGNWVRVYIAGAVGDSTHLLRIPRISLHGTNSNPFGGGGGGADSIVTRRSTDNGASFEDIVVVGDSISADAGFDTVKVGTAVLSAADGEVSVATSGGSYSAATGGDTTGSYARAIWGYDISGGDFVMAAAAAVSSETLWKVVGGVKSAITPNDGSNDGLVVGPFGLAMPVGSSSAIFALMLFGGTAKLARSTNGGGSWAITSGINAGAKGLACKNANQLYIANSSNVLYSEDGGATFITKAAPGSSLLGIAVQ